MIAENTNLYFEQISAVFSGVADLKRVFQYAQERRQNQGKGTLLFVDEIHRFNKSQQDGFLPFVEDGTIILVGATTENPSFELNAALLSRCQVFVLNRLNKDNFEELLIRAEKELGKKLPIDDDAREFLKDTADGDGRYILNLAESIWAYANEDEIFDKDGNKEYLYFSSGGTLDKEPIISDDINVSVSNNNPSPGIGISMSQGIPGISEDMILR